MSLARDAVKGMLLAHALPIAGLLFSGAVLTYGAAKIFLRMERHNGFVAGYGQARDSVDALTIKRLAAQHARDTLRSNSAAKAARDSSSALVADRRRFDTTQRHTPRLEALTVPVTADTSLVGVFVQTTGEHFVLPRRAAMYWQTSDSLVGVAQRLLAKYAAANAGWANAYTAEHEARVGADSLSALWRTRALANIAPVSASHGKRDAVFATIGAAVALIAKNQFRHR